MKRVFSILFALAMVLGFSLVAVPAGVIEASSATIDVSSVRNISNTGDGSGNGYYERDPQLLRASSGTWYLIYSRSQTSFTAGNNPDALKYDIYYQTSTDSGTTWSAAAKLLDAAAISANANFRSSTICEADGRVWVIGANVENLEGDIYAKTYSGGSWSGQSMIFNGTYDTGAFHLDAIAEGNNIRLFYGIQNEINGIGFIKYNGSTDTWDSSVTQIGTSAGHQIPRVIKEGSSYYLVSTDWSNILYTSTTAPDTTPWPAATTIVTAPSGGAACDPAILKYGASGGSDDLIVFHAPSYSDNSQPLEYVYSSTAGSTWSSSIPFTDAAHGTQYSWDMMPRAYMKDASTIMVFFSMEQRGVNRGQGDIVVCEWDTSSTIGNGHYTTIQDAVDNASSGDTIVVTAGTYAGAAVSKDVTIEAKAGDVVTINDGPLHPAGFLRAGFWFQGFTGSGATIRGFHFAGTNQAGYSDDGKLDFAIFSRGADDVTVEQNIIDDMLQAITSWHGDRWQIRDNQISDLWTLNGGGIGILVGANDGSTAQDNVVSDNQIDGTLSVYSGDGGGYDGTGIVLYTDFRYTAGGNVINTLVSGNDISMVSNNEGVVDINGIELTDTRDSDGNPATIYNSQVVSNTIHGNSDDGIAVSAGTTNNDFHFNCIYGNQGLGMSYSGTGLVDAEDNWWGDDSGPYHATLNPSGTGDPVGNNIDFDPWRGKQTSVSTTTGTGTASFASSSGGVANLAAVPTPPSPPVTLPHGMFNFTICCIPSGGTATLTVTLPGPVPVGTRWYKYIGGSWYSLPIVGGGTSIITVTLTDGAFPDDEDTAPGQITDQGGPGFGGAVGWDTYPINKVRVLLPWIALLAAIVAAASLLVVRRRRAQS